MPSSINKSRRRVALLLIVMLALLGLAPSALAQGGAPADPQVIPPQAHPYGVSYSEWSARWWQWVFSLPTSTNGIDTHPFLLDGAVDCGYAQPWQVWFLAGTYRTTYDPGSNIYIGHAARSCTVPAGTPLFFPIINAEGDIIDSNGQPGPWTAEELQAAIKAQMDSAVHMYATIDGQPVARPERYRVQARPFSFTMPDNNLYQHFGIPAAPGTYYPMVADGYFVMLAPLPVGRHTIAFGGELPDPYFFKLDITYEITVVAHT